MPVPIVVVFDSYLPVFNTLAGPKSLTIFAFAAIHPLGLSP